MKNTLILALASLLMGGCASAAPVTPSGLPAASSPLSGSEIVFCDQVNGGALSTRGCTASQIATIAQTTSLQKSANLSDVGSVATSRTNLGVTATGSDTTYMFRANNGSDVGSASSFRSNIGLGTAAVESTGSTGHFLAFLDNASNAWSGTQQLGHLSNNNGATLTSGSSSVIGTGGSPIFRCQAGGGGQNCGDVGGEITLKTGSAGISTSGTVATVGFGAAYTVAPACTVTMGTSTGELTTMSHTTSTTQLVISVSANLSTSTTYDINYVCVGT